MMLAFLSLEHLWRNALGAIPFAVLIALLCRVVPCRPSTRHSLWLILLISLLVPPLVSSWDYASFWTEARAWTARTIADESAQDGMKAVKAPPSVEPGVLTPNSMPGLRISDDAARDVGAPASSPTAAAACGPR